MPVCGRNETAPTREDQPGPLCLVGAQPSACLGSGELPQCGREKLTASCRATPGTRHSLAGCDLTPRQGVEATPAQVAQQPSPGSLRGSSVGRTSRCCHHWRNATSAALFIERTSSAAAALRRRSVSVLIRNVIARRMSCVPIS
jgi:hypothetical protein